MCGLKRDRDVQPSPERRLIDRFVTEDQALAHMAAAKSLLICPKFGEISVLRIHQIFLVALYLNREVSTLSGEKRMNGRGGLCSS